jgi:hypothetical protein
MAAGSGKTQLKQKAKTMLADHLCITEDNIVNVVLGEQSKSVMISIK